jgi:zinc transport system substrate-binding protein
MSAEPLNVYVVNYPLKYFAERIGGEQINLVLPAPTGIDPVYWIPAIPTIAAYQQADLILINGAGYAKWVDKVSLPRSKVVDTSKKFKDRYITIEGAVTHSHGPQGEHAHEGIAFTTWLDFSLAAEQAKAITTALSRKRPDLKNAFQKNYQKLEQDLLKLDQDLKTLISKDPSRPLVVSHPVYDYFARRYGLNIKSVHWEPDEIPTNEQMIELNSILKEHPAQWMIWEGEPMKESAQRLKAIGVDSLVFDPCGNIPDQGDFLSVMRHNVKNLKPVFK